MTDTRDLLYHVDGDLVPASEATVRVDDRGFRYGDAAFETCRAYGGTIFAWDAHVDRLETTCELLSIDHDLSAADLRRRIDETLAANDLADAYVRLSITRGVQPGKLTPRSAVDPTVVVSVKPLPRGGVEGERVWDEPAIVRTVDTRRIPDEAIPAAAKTHNYLNGILARAELRGTDADEALVCDLEGNVAEGAASNVWFVRDGTLYTPTIEGPVLPGITRGIVRELASGADVPVSEGSYAIEDVLAADEAFLTNRTWELRPIASIDDIAVGGGPVTGRLSRAYDERVEDSCYR
ncbi:aminotransferase class IV [Halosolutus gelatinilyticus]|uniref:aminotransferase class IV n=1 Tax=Halosolutus gelatinilyticus TaxID=2931975 RepID=UPI001FF131B8|nr:aminotransferase class IV [Halosolutus gelatinilyticus]